MGNSSDTHLWSKREYFRDQFSYEEDGEPSGWWEIKSLESSINAFSWDGEKNVPELRERKKGHKVQGE